MSTSTILSTAAPAHWPRTPRRLAAALREHVELPGAQVRLRGDYIEVAWVDGPTRDAVRAEVLRSFPMTKAVGYHVRRTSSVCTWAGVYLLPEHRGLRGWTRGQRTWRHVESRDFKARPLSADERRAGEVLAGLARVPANARVGYSMRRWDTYVHNTLALWGDDAFAALLL